MLDPKKIYAKLKTRNVPMMVLIMALALAAGALTVSLMLYFWGVYTAGSGSEYFAMSRALQSKAVTLIILGGLGSALTWYVIRRTQKKER